MPKSTCASSGRQGVEVRPDVVATGELTLTGHIMSVGGIVSKIRAACVDDVIGTVILPQDNYIGERST